MPTFIDESGDTGPVDRGGKSYFRLAAVWVPTFAAAEAFRESIRALRALRSLRKDFEFRYAQTHAHAWIREAFFEAAMGHEFRFSVCSIDKTGAAWANKSGRDFHYACATCLAVNLRAAYRSCETEGQALREAVLVDSNADSEFLATIKRQFRGLTPGRSNPPLVGKVQFRKSSPDEMIQLADMVCGATGAFVDGKDGRWYNVIRERCLGLDKL